ncbi:hypothetical protein JTB14_033378 [Gonioctena quinquepunctata]|nr:hypothetical protein JTB14_033378 [Gonioctena quinquepunctata]
MIFIPTNTIEILGKIKERSKHYKNITCITGIFELGFDWQEDTEEELLKWEIPREMEAASPLKGRKHQINQNLLSLL